MSDLDAALRRFFSALEDRLTAGAAREADAEAAAGIAAFARDVAAVRPVPRPDSGPPVPPLPVCRFWDAALAGATAVPAEEVRALGPALRWTQNPNYRRRPPDPRFLETYGYAVIAGPEAAEGPPLVAGDGGLAVGLLLLGPGTHYPLHRHPATELYCVIGGAAEWRRGDSPWRVRPPGALIHHPSGLAHATRTGAEPLLAVYLWRGDLATHAKLIAADAGAPDPGLPAQARP